MLVAIEKIIKEGDQRSALSTSRHIRRAKIRDHRYTEPRRNHRAFTGLPRHRQFSPEKPLRHSLVIERLSVTTHQVKFHPTLARPLPHPPPDHFSTNKISPLHSATPAQLTI